MGRPPSAAEPGALGTVVAQRTAAARAKVPHSAAGGPDRSYRAVLVAADAGTALAAAGPVAGLPGPRPALVAALVAAFVLLVLALQRGAGLYRRVGERYVLDEAPAVAGRLVVAWCALTAVCAALPVLAEPTAESVVRGCALHVVLAVAVRALVYRRRRRALVRHPCPTLLVGPESVAAPVAAALQRHPLSGVRPVGIVGDPQPSGDAEPTGPA
ncbi:transferase, partial [Streptomyces sp. GXMU-J5]|nr:transferase [Streptomyces beihaiensis]